MDSAANYTLRNGQMLSFVGVERTELAHCWFEDVGLICSRETYSDAQEDC